MRKNVNEEPILLYISQKLSSRHPRSTYTNFLLLPVYKWKMIGTSRPSKIISISTHSIVYPQRFKFFWTSHPKCFSWSKETFTESGPCGFPPFRVFVDGFKSREVDFREVFHRTKNSSLGPRNPLPYRVRWIFPPTREYIRNNLALHFSPLILSSHCIEMPIPLRLYITFRGLLHFT